MALDVLLPPLQEAVGSMAKASTPEPVGPKPLWKHPGMHLPDYIEHVANDLRQEGKDESKAVEEAIGIVQNWAHGHDGKGHKVHPDTQAAAAKAIAEWEADKAKAHALSAAKGKVSEGITATEQARLALEAHGRLERLRQAVGVDAMRQFVVLERDVSTAERKSLKKRKLAMSDESFPIANQGDLDNAVKAIGRGMSGGKSRAAIVAHIKRAAKILKLKLPPSLNPQVQEAESGPTMLKCPKCGTVQPASNDKCRNCGHDLTAARKAKMAKLNEAAGGSWQPELRRVASAPNEVERHDVYDQGQHVGTIGRRRPYSQSEPDRFSVTAVNGDSLGDLGIKSQPAALDTLRRHLEEAPARIQPHRNGKFLVAKPRSYGGSTTYTEYPNEPTARYAAGLPTNPTSPEQTAAVQAVTEMVTHDLLALGGYSPEMAEQWELLKPRVEEGARLVPFGAARRSF